jgi:hypothetical protein
VYADVVEAFPERAAPIFDQISGIGRQAGGEISLQFCNNEAPPEQEQACRSARTDWQRMSALWMARSLRTLKDSLVRHGAEIQQT